MSWLCINHESGRLRAAWTGLVLIAAGVALSACSQDGGTSAGDYEAASYDGPPAELESVEGTDVQRVTFTAFGAKQVGLQTAEVSGNGEQKVVPYAAVLFDAEGNTFTYTSPEPLTFVREDIEVDHVDGDRAVLSEGPPDGTEVVTVGAQEVYGTEFEVGN